LGRLNIEKLVSAIFLFLLLVVFGGCISVTKTVYMRPEEFKAEEEKPTKFEPKGEPVYPAETITKVTDWDLNEDGKKDVTWVYYVGEIIVAAKGDTNDDGETDYFWHYEEGKVILAQADTNYDGAIDTMTFYDENENPYFSISDINSDGEVDNWLYRDETGKLMAWQSDEDFDGQIDTWVYSEGGVTTTAVDTNMDANPDVWTLTKDDKILRIDYDTNFDGEVDRTETKRKHGGIGNKPHALNSSSR